MEDSDKNIEPKVEDKAQEIDEWADDQDLYKVEEDEQSSPEVQSEPENASPPPTSTENNQDQDEEEDKAKTPVEIALKQMQTQQNGGSGFSPPISNSPAPESNSDPSSEKNQGSYNNINVQSEEDDKLSAEDLKKQVDSFRKSVKDGDKIDDINRQTANLLTQSEQQNEILKSQAENGEKDEKKEPDDHIIETSQGMTLGETLVTNSIITRDQLEIALKEQRESTEKKELGTILVELNFISDTVLSKVLAETSGVQSVDLRSVALDQDLIRRIPKTVASRYKIIALHLEGSELSVATSDVYNVLALDQVKKHFSKSIQIKPFFANDFQITETIDQYYDYEMNMSAIIKEIESGSADLSGQEDSYVNPTVRLVDSMLTDAVKKGASDIHLEPESEFVRLRYRIDGRLLEIISFHKQYWSAISVRIKIVAGLNIAETRNPQDGRITMIMMGRKVDFRISTLPTVWGENVVSRILDKSRSLVKLSELGLSETHIKLLKTILKRPEGVIIVTGPTGSGKTTTLYSVLSYINNMETNIMTLEDPVEYQLPVIRQSQVRENSDLTFDRGIRTLMRQDPDIIFVGEVRDYDTAAMTVRAAMTGHQVFTTLHTNDALGAIPRLVDLGIKGSLLAGSIICSLAQRLARRLCYDCKKEYTPTEDECILLDMDPKNPPKLFKHVGCNKCYNTGYKGRIPLYEILPVDRELDDMISREASRKEMLDYAKSKGFTLMYEDGIDKVKQGITDIDEIINTVDMTERMRDVNIFL